MTKDEFFDELIQKGYVETKKDKPNLWQCLRKLFKTKDRTYNPWRKNWIEHMADFIFLVIIPVNLFLLTLMLFLLIISGGK